jgi:hypothetical protein
MVPLVRNINLAHTFRRHVAAKVIETLLYEPRGRGFDSRWRHWNRIIALESTKPLTEMSTRNISWGVMAAYV